MNKTIVKGFIRIEYNNQIWYEISQKEIHASQEKKQITYSSNSVGTARRRTTSEGSSLSG